MKTCTRCLDEKDIGEFRKGLVCRDCERIETRYRMARPENRVGAAYRRAKLSAAKAGVYDDLTMEDVRYIFALANGRCAYSGQIDNRLTLEHIIPFAKGGANTLANITAVSAKANRKKHAGDPSEYLDTHAGFYVTKDIVELVAARRGVPVETVTGEFLEAQADYNNELYARMIQKLEAKA